MNNRAQHELTIFWFRRDLRLDDNTGLYHALLSGHAVMPVFIFDTDILEDLSDRSDRRIHFIHREITRLKKDLEENYGSTLHVFHGRPEAIFQDILSSDQVSAVYANEDYEPYARKRDENVETMLVQRGCKLHMFKDHVIFGKDEIVKTDGTPYTVFTPYSKQWRAALSDEHIASVNSRDHLGALVQCEPSELPSLQSLGFLEKGSFDFPARTLDIKLLQKYDQLRNIPAADATSHLGVHLRFGTVSLRRIVEKARELSDTFLNELIWREFFQQILWHFPFVEHRSFKPQYEELEWRNQEQEFEAWCKGMTGYELVDAGMRELNATGFMHNRVRMVVASFLTKHLLIDWRWGEAYFAEKLLDYELASNNGNWQWAAGTGCDAAPYFRIFNPMEQVRKFDPEDKYVSIWIPELRTSDYPAPIVDHMMARKRALKVYRAAATAGAIKE